MTFSAACRLLLVHLVSYISLFEGMAQKHTWRQSCMPAALLAAVDGRTHMCSRSGVDATLAQSMHWWLTSGCSQTAIAEHEKSGSMTL